MYESDLWRVVWRPPPPLPVRHVEWLTVRAQWLTLWPVLGPSGSRWKFTTISVICDNLVTRNPLTFGWRTGRCGWSAAGKIYCSGENEGIDLPITTPCLPIIHPQHTIALRLYTPRKVEISDERIYSTRSPLLIIPLSQPFPLPRLYLSVYILYIFIQCYYSVQYVWYQVWKYK